jgi:hypothetical protein
VDKRWRALLLRWLATTDEELHMADPTADFFRDYQTLARQSWDAWTRQVQQSTAPQNAFQQSAGAAAPTNATLERTLDGLKGYLDWMQGTTATAAAPGADWQQQMQQWFGSANQPFAQAFAGIDSAGAQGFARQWQDWMRTMQRAGFGAGSAPAAPTPMFGMDREQQMQQQALAQAMLASAQATARYQTLIQRASAQGMQRLQDKLAQHAEPGHQIESLKGLYDLWVDASEEAYAEIALTDEFRTAYGEMVNTQMHVRQLQQKYTEALCLQLGIPTRSEVASLGKRLQAVRREVRAKHDAEVAAVGEIDALRREIAALERRIGAKVAAKPAAQTGTAGARGSARSSAAPARKPVASGRKVAAAASRAQPQVKAVAGTRRATAKAASRKPVSRPKARAADTTRTSSRKRK